MKENSWGAEVVKANMSDSSRQSELGTVWGKKGGWGLRKAIEPWHQSQQNGPAVHSHHNKKTKQNFRDKD